MCGLNAGCAKNAYTGGAQPFFEQGMGGATSAYCTGFSSCAAAVASKQAANIQTGSVYSMWTALSRDASWSPALGRTLPDSRVPGATASPPGSPACTQLPSLPMTLTTRSATDHPP